MCSRSSRDSEVRLCVSLLCVSNGKVLEADQVCVACVLLTMQPQDAKKLLLESVVCSGHARVWVRSSQLMGSLVLTVLTLTDQPAHKLNQRNPSSSALA